MRSLLLLIVLLAGCQLPPKCELPPECDTDDDSTGMLRYYDDSVEAFRYYEGKPAVFVDLKDVDTTERRFLKHKQQSFWDMPIWKKLPDGTEIVVFDGEYAVDAVFHRFPDCNLRVVFDRTTARRFDEQKLTISP